MQILPLDLGTEYYLGQSLFPYVGHTVHFCSVPSSYLHSLPWEVIMYEFHKEFGKKWCH